MIIHLAIIKKDIKLCNKKHWYPEIETELKRVVKLLNTDLELPGEYPMRGFKGELSGKVLHARINLPNSNIGKSKGARLVYVKTGTNEHIRVLYVGGHKDKNYDSSNFVKEISYRFYGVDKFISYEDFMEMINTSL